MAKDYVVIKGQANIIRNETAEGGNTAAEVGGAIYDVADKLEEVDGVLTTAIGTKLPSSSVVDDLASTSAAAPLSANQGKVLNETKADKTTQVVAGSGLTGGGALSGDVTVNVGNTDDSIVVGVDGIKVDTQNSLTSTSTTKPLSAAQGKALQDNKAEKTRTITAGNGLTGGGDLTADRTINIAPSDDSLVVTADNVKVNTNNTLTSTSTTQPLSANQGKVLNEKVVQVETDLNSSDFTINIKEIPIQSWANAYIDNFYVMHESSTNEISGFIKVNEGWNYTIATNRNTATVNAVTFYESATQESIIPGYRVDKISVGTNENNLYDITIPSGVNYIRINNYPPYKQKAGVWCKSNVIRCGIKDTILLLSTGAETLGVEYETSYFTRLNKGKLFYITSAVNSTTAPCYYDKYFKFISSISSLSSGVRTPIYPGDVPEGAMYIRYSGKPKNTTNPLFAGEIEGQDLMQIKDKDFWSFDLDSSFYNTSVKIPISYRKKGTQLNIITDSGISMLYLYKETDFGNSSFGLADNWSSFYQSDYINLISDIIINETNTLVSFDSTNRPIEILHKIGAITIRTDIIVYGTVYIEETRTLNTGSSLKIKTTLETLNTELTWL